MSEDPIDTFISYWNVFEILGSKYHTETLRTSSGIKNKIYQCFLDYIGAQDLWGVPQDWISTVCELRNQLVHGGREIDIDTIEEIEKYRLQLHDQAHFLLLKIDENH